MAETLAAWRHFARYADESHDEQDLPRWQRPALDGEWPPERLCGPAVDDLPTSGRTRLAGTPRRKGHSDRVLGGEVSADRTRPHRPDDRDEGRTSADGGRGRDKTRLVHRVYTVFNAKQMDGIPTYAPKQHTPFEAVQAGEQILENSGAQVVHDQANRAYYNRAQDRIHLPPKEAFKDAAGYYGTALHELAHFSGHPSRLNRPTLTESYRFGDVNYAKEELRAELASVFMAAERGIPHNPEQHAAYVGSWIKKWRARHFWINHQQTIM